MVWCFVLQNVPLIPYSYCLRFGARCLLSSTGSMWQLKLRSASCCTPWIPTSSEPASFWSSSMSGGMTRLLSLPTTYLPWRNMPLGWTSKRWNFWLAAKSPRHWEYGAACFCDLSRTLGAKDFSSLPFLSSWQDIGAYSQGQRLEAIEKRSLITQHWTPKASESAFQAKWELGLELRPDCMVPGQWGKMEGLVSQVYLLFSSPWPDRLNWREERLIWAHVSGLWSVVDEQFLVPVCRPSSLKEPLSTPLCLLFFTF